LVSDVAQLVGAVGVVVSLLILAWQTMKLSRQTELSNLQGRYQSLHNAGDRYHSGLGLMFKNPELRAYFYNEKPCPPDDPNRDQALIVAEMIADSIDHALRVSAQFPDKTHNSGWMATALFLARQPIFAELTNERSDYFPDLLAVIRVRKPTSLSTTEVTQAPPELHHGEAA
jgi:hypothetical protein